MKHIVLKSIKIDNFKGISHFTADFSKVTFIYGQNAAGKTSVFDALSWLLFDKDAFGRTKFDIRPLDENNDLIHHIEISVEAVLNIDGRDYTLKKVQKEIWQKPRGAKEAILKNAGSNFFEVDGFPQKAGDYKSFISGICQESVFQLVTNPMAFPTMNWKDQRKILESIMPEINESELASQKPEYQQFAEELQEHSISEILDRDKKQRTLANKQMEEIPARIDELNNSLEEEPDFEMFQAERMKLQAQLADVNGQMESGSGIAEKKSAIRANIQIAKADIESERRKIKSEHNERVRATEETLHSIDRQIRDANNIIRFNTNQIENANLAIGFKTKKIESLREQYNVIRAREFDSSNLFCETCGQALPQDKIAEIENNFNRNKQKQIEENVSAGRDLSTQIKKEAEEVERLNAETEDAKKKLSLLHKQLEEVQYEKQRITEPDYETETIVSLEKQIKDLQVEMDGLNTGDVSAELKQKASQIQAEIDRCTEQLAIKSTNQRIRERISDLEAKKNEIIKTISILDKRIDMLEELMIEKLNEISKGVDKKFKFVNWKLFKDFVNGGAEECCTCTVNGVPFASLNHAAKVNAGLDIINTISQIYGVSAPIFIDNRESVTSILDIDSQIINLVVSPEDKSLRVVEG